MRNIILILVVIPIIFAVNTKFTPGVTWLDTDNKPISAHGAGVLYTNGAYYWYGEAEDPNHIGVACYQSTDLLNWDNKGIVLTVASTSNGSSTYIIERPKVIFSKLTNLYVLWFHHDDASYSLAHTGVATSPSPLGPFKFIASFLPNGLESRDMTVYEDPSNGNAYLIRSAGHTNLGIAVSQLTPDYLNVTAQISYIDQSREGPALLQRNGLNYLVLSHCTGWATNPADLWTSSSLSGTWNQIGNPTTSANTYNSQSTYFLPLQGKYAGHFIFLADRWNYPNLVNATYIWLPVMFEGNTLSIPWYDSWDLSVFG